MQKLQAKLKNAPRNTGVELRIMNKLIDAIHPPPKGGGLLATEDK